MDKIKFITFLRKLTDEGNKQLKNPNITQEETIRHTSILSTLELIYNYVSNGYFDNEKK